MRIIYKTFLTAFLFAALFINPIHAQVSWTRLHDFPGGARYSPTAFSINDIGYMGLGLDSVSGNISPTDWWQYNPSTDSWTQKGTFPGSGRWTAASFVINGMGYVVTGATTNGLTTDAWQYNPTTDTWTPIATFPGTAREQPFAFASDSLGYIGCGFISGSLVNDFWQYSPATNTWTQLANYPGANGEAQFAFTLLGNGYVGMGTALNGSSYTNEFFEYKVATNTWIAAPQFIGPGEQNAFSFTLGENGYVLCGTALVSGSSYNNYRGLYEYSLESGSWTQLDSFPGTARSVGAGFVLGDTVIFGMGSTSPASGDSALGDLWSTGYTLSGIKNISADQDMLFPNPTSSKVTVSYTDAATVPASFKLYDMTGRQTNAAYTMGRGNTSIDLSGLSSGVYLLEAFDKNQISLWKNKILKQ